MLAVQGVMSQERILLQSWPGLSFSELKDFPPILRGGLRYVLSALTGLELPAFDPC